MEFNLEPDARGAARLHLDDGRQPGPGHRRAGRGAVRRRDRARRARGDDLDGACRSTTRRAPRTACSGATRTRSASTRCSPGAARTGSTRSTARWSRSRRSRRATPARLPELRALGPDRGGRRVRRGRHQLPGSTREGSEGERVMTIDIKSMGYVRVACTDLEQWKLFAGKVLGLAEGRGPNPEHQYWRIDQVSARLVVVPLRRRPARLRRLGGRRPAGAAGGPRAPAEGRRRLRGGHQGGARRAPGAGAGPVPRPVGQRLRAVPRHHLRVAPGRDAVRRDVRHRRPGHGPHRAAGARRRGGAGVLHRRPRASGCATR